METQWQKTIWGNKQKLSLAIWHSWVQLLSNVATATVSDDSEAHYVLEQSLCLSACVCVYAGGQWVHAVPEAEPAWNSQRGRKEISFPCWKTLWNYTVTTIPYQQGTAAFHWSSLAVCTQSYR